MGQRRNDFFDHAVGEVVLLDLKLVKGRTTIEGLSGSGRAGFGGCAGAPAIATLAGLSASRTVATKRKPLRGSVLMRRCSSPESPIAFRAAFRRVVSAASDTLRPFQMALIRSSLLTTRSRLWIR